MTYGGYLQGGAVYHSQCGEVLFTHMPGLRVVIPSNAQDANGLLRTAIRCDDPVLFLEHKHLYRQTYNKGIYPGPDYMIPFGKAARAARGQRRDDRHLRRARPALARRRAPGWKRTASRPRSSTCARSRPYDWEAIATSVRKTGKVIVAHEDSMSWGYGAEIAARIADELFEYLDAPVRRIGALDTFVGYAPVLEDAILPAGGGHRGRRPRPQEVLGLRRARAAVAVLEPHHVVELRRRDLDDVAVLERRHAVQGAGRDVEDVARLHLHVAQLAFLARGPRLEEQPARTGP